MRISKRGYIVDVLRNCQVRIAYKEFCTAIAAACFTADEPIPATACKTQVDMSRQATQSTFTYGRGFIQ